MTKRKVDVKSLANTSYSQMMSLQPSKLPVQQVPWPNTGGRYQNP